MNTSKKLQNAKALYIEGIKEGRVREAVTKYTGDRYTQHSTGVADGVEGFVTFFEPFIERCKQRDIRIVRALEDGPYVFVHVYQDINNGEAEWVTADIFDTDENDKIIEHWDVIQAYKSPTPSGRTMVDGPTEVEDLDKTDMNKEVVQNFFNEVLIGGDFSRVTNYISSSQYDQHNPEVADGLEGFARHVREMAEQDTTARYLALHRMVGQGNFVATLSEVKINEDTWAIIDLFRLSEGKIVEHWDVQEKVLPEDQWGNSGKF